MCKIVDDLLNLSRLESGHEKVELMPIDPTDALREAWEACSGLAKNERSISGAVLKR